MALAVRALEVDRIAIGALVTIGAFRVSRVVFPLCDSLGYLNYGFTLLISLTRIHIV